MIALWRRGRDESVTVGVDDIEGLAGKYVVNRARVWEVRRHTCLISMRPPSIAYWTLKTIMITPTEVRTYRINC